MPTNVVGLAHHPTRNDLDQCPGMILDIQPVTNLRSVAIHRQRLARQGIEDHVRDQLLGEVIRPVVVRAVGHQHRQAVGALPGAHQVIRTGLGGRVGRTGGVGRGFGEQIIRTLEVAIHLIGRNMVEAERRLGFIFQVIPVTAGRLQQRIGANDIGLDEFGRPIDGAIHMRLGGQVHHCCGAELGKHLVQRGCITNIHLVEAIAGRAIYIGQRLQIAGIGEFVEVGDLVIGVLDQVTNHCRSDEAGAAGDEYLGAHFG
ncbi:hypothetical protein D9M68_717000 [compost metagenome]